MVNCLGLGPGLYNGNHVPVLMYADDICLMATSASELQTLIDTINAFCNSVGLTISPSKSNVVVFSKVSHAMPTFSCSSDAIPVVQQTKYSGLTFHHVCGVKNACQFLLSRMKADWAVLQRQYAGLRSPVLDHLVLQLYKACVPPVASYVCEVWGQLPMSAENHKCRQALTTQNEQNLRAITGLRSSSSRSILLTELSELPTTSSWLLRTVTFWNNVAALPELKSFSNSSSG